MHSVVGDIACLDLGGTTIKAAVVVDGELVDRRTIPVDGDVLPVLSGLLVEWSGAHELDGVGVALPGVVTPDGRLASAHGKYESLLGMDIPAWVADATGVPASRCVVENDARAALLGEVSPGGCAPGETDAVLLVLGTGIGTAAVVDGVPVRGRLGHAGILGGHVTIDVEGPECLCGNVGCAEAFAGAWALPLRLREQPDGERSALAGRERFGHRELVAAAGAGDAPATRLLQTCLDAWASVLVTLCHQYDPAVAVLSGGPLNDAGPIVAHLDEWLERHLWRGQPRPRLVVSTDPTWSVVAGLATLVPTPEEK